MSNLDRRRFWPGAGTPLDQILATLSSNTNSSNAASSISQSATSVVIPYPAG